MTAWGQDTRSNVTEPVIPAVRCAVLSAQLTADSTPTGIAAASETSFDTSRVQAALTACVSGQAVELAPSGSYNAFLIQPITIPAGVTLLVDAGVTVYASRNANDYQVGTSTNCGTIGGSGSGCQPLISISAAPGAAIMGNGVIDGRGATTMLGGTYTGTTWWDMSKSAHAQGISQVQPVLLNVSASNFVTLYGISFQNSPHFHITASNSNNMIVWGLKINTSWDTQNTDGFDPGGYTNLTVENSYFNDGDDEIALTGGSSPVTQDTTILNNHFFDGHGMSIGSHTTYGVQNMLVKNLVINSTPANTNATGLRIKSDSAGGGLVTNITYLNVCMLGVTSPIVMNAYYATSTGTQIPQFNNITLQNVHATSEGKVTLVGYDTNSTNSISDLLGITFNNVTVDGVASSDVTAEFAQITLGPDPVNFATYLDGSGVSVTNKITDSNSSYSCPATVFNPIAGEIVHGPYQVASSTNITLQAQIINPRETSFATYVAASASATGVTLQMPLPSGTVEILEGGTVLGTATLNVAQQQGSINNLSISIGKLAVGTHTLTGYYSGDSNYSPLSFGNYTLLVSAGVTTNTTLTTSTSAAIPGQSITFTATVTGSGGTPTGSVIFYDGSYPIGAVVLSGGTAQLSTTSLSNITHTLSAVYNGDTGFATSTSSPVTVTITKAASQVNFTITSPSLLPTSLLTSLGISTTIPTLVYGQPVTMTTSVSPASGVISADIPSGNMAYKLNGKTSLNTTLDATGKAVYSVNTAKTTTPAAPWNDGTNTVPTSNAVYGSYGGDTNFAASASTTQNINLIPGTTTTTTLVASSTTPNEGQPVTLTATVAIATAMSGAAYGLTATDTVTFIDTTTAITLGTATINATTGVATLQLSSLVVGAHAMTATYNGNMYCSISTSSSLPVTASLVGTTLALTTNADSGRATPGQSILLSAALTAANSGTAGGSVTFYDGLASLGTVALNGNTATLTTGNLAVAGHTLLAAYSSDGIYASAASNTVYLVVSSLASGTPVPPVLLPQTISTYAGTQGTTGTTGNGALATTATFSTGLQSLAVDGFGNLYVGDGGNKEVRFVNPVSGLLTRFEGAGTACTAKLDKVGDGCFSTQTSGSTPAGLAADNAGNIYLAGYGDNLIHEIPAGTQLMSYVAGLVASTTVSGTAETIAAPTANGTVATSAALDNPRGVAVDNLGNIYIADTGNYQVRVVYKGGTFANLTSPVIGDIYLLTGNTSTTVSDGVAATASGNSGVQGLYVDNQQNIFLADATRLRVVYEGGTAVKNLIAATNSGVTPTAGFIYTIAGGGPGAVSTTAALGTSVVLGGINRLAPDANGNLYLGDAVNSAVYFFDMQTGYLRTIAGTPGTTGFKGDGGAAVSALLGVGSGGAIAVAVDPASNLFLTDVGNDIVRKVSANLTFNATAVGLNSSQTVMVHFSANDAPASSAAFTLPITNGDFSLGSSPVCVTNADATQDCSLVVKFSPTLPGLRLVPLLVTANSGAASSYILSGVGQAPALVMTAGTAATLGSNLTPRGVALDIAGNLYLADGYSQSLLKFAAGASNSTVLATGLSSPGQIAVDGLGSVYVADTGNNRVLSVSRSGAVSTVGSGLSAPRGVAVDSFGDVYIADSGNARIIQVPFGNGTQLTVGTGFSTPVQLAFDLSNNLYILDTGNNLVAEIAPGSSISSTIDLGGVTPTAFALDAAANLYIADQGSQQIYLYPVGVGTGSSIASGTTSVLGMAFKTGGKLYVADSGATVLESLDLTSTAMKFISSAIPLTINLTNAGNASLSFTAPGYTQTDSTDFTIASATTNGCALTSTLASAANCAITATFSPLSDLSLTDTVALQSNSVSPVSVILSGQAPATTATVIAFNGLTPTTPVFGNAVSFSATVSAKTGSTVPTGTLTFTIDSNTAAAQTVGLDGTGTASASFSGLSGGAHTIAFNYTPNAFCASSTLGPVSFSLGLVTPTLRWTPVSTLTYGTALSAVMNASTAGGLSGTYAYTATSANNVVTALTTTSYLPVGTYTLGVTFTPADATDYTIAVASGSRLVITQASTAAGIGPTTNVVAADGTGNYSTLSSAIAATPAGGSIYIEPGTYFGQNTVSLGNIALRGLGGDPTKVILTASDSIGTSGSDQKSATLQVTASNFYMENLSVINTYQTDNPTVTTNTQSIALYLSGDKDVVFNSQMTSQQDTLYANNGNSGVVGGSSRQYFNQCKVTGNVDYIFGDAAAAFDNCVLYTVYHGTVTGETTITAQDKKYATGTANDYLSGYVIANSQFLSENDNGIQPSIYYGRPWGVYSTVVLLNNYVDAMNPAGWVEFTPGTTNYLPTSTYAEYGTTGSGAAGTREQYAISLSAAQAVAYQPDTFLAGTDQWNPTSALGSYIAAVVPTATSASVNAASSITLVARIAPQSLGTPTGRATFLDGTNVLSAVTLDALGEASYTTSVLAAGRHNLTIQYAGDSNFIASTSSPVAVTVIALHTTTGLQVSNAAPVYGQAVTVSANVAPVAATGTVTFTLDNVAQTPVTLNSGVGSLVLPATLGFGGHTVSATYNGDSTYAASSSTSALSINVSQATSASVRLQSNANPAVLANIVTFTATVASPVSTPTGTVTFFDGTTSLGTGNITAGVATYATSTLVAGSHSITAVYNGDNNFKNLSSSALAQVVQDFTYTLGGSTAIGTTPLTVLPGGTVTLPIPFSPQNGSTFPAAVNFSISGLPVGATATFTPSTLAAGSAATTVTLSITVPSTTSAAAALPARWPLSGLPIALGMLLLPFAGRLRRASRSLRRMALVLLLLAAGVAGVSGCSSGGGFFSQTPQNYTLTITATSGNLQHSTQITLNVQ